MLDRAIVVDERFVSRIQQADFPKSRSTMDPETAELDKKTAIDLFDSQIKSRLLDLIARQLKEKGLSFYTIGSSGHEGNAVWGQVFRPEDMAFLHYRSGAFYLQRAKKLPGTDGVRDILLSLVAAATDPISGGRHKVFGSVPLNIPPQTSTIASHLPKALGAAISITRAKELKVSSNLNSDSVILCSFGDASTNHASAQATLNACSWMAQQNYPLPIVFICEDNGIGISVPTPRDWIERSIGARPGLHYLSCDGLNIADAYAVAQEAEYLARIKKQPVFLHMRCVRLLGHAGSDIESQYCTQEEIEAREADDPLLHTAGLLYQEGWMSIQDMLSLYQNNKDLIEAKAVEAIRQPKLSSADEIMSSLIPIVPPKQIYPPPSEEQRANVFANAFSQITQKRNLCQQINFALTDLMLQYPNMLVFGEDVGKKGGVYRVTADLQARFGRRRVFDTLLDETTILGTAIGLAHNGFIPVPEIQFLAYLHNAEDQLRGEASTLSFFSSGQYQNPMVVRIASLAYQKGFGGHFHNDNSIAVLRDLPGVIVACPSNGPDAAKMLRTCMRLAYGQGRVVVFLEPIALYMTKDLHVPGDNEWLFHYPAPEVEIPLGEVGIYGEGTTVILTYANGYYLSRQAAQVLQEEHKISVKVVDLRWLNPLPGDAILREIAKAKQVLIVDEGRRSGSVSEGLMSLLLEEASSSLKIKRITGKDCFIPLGNAWQYLLPSKESIIEAVIALESDKREKESGRLVVS
ncbi:dehydrogenase E1 component subunit alpha/beta [Legionella longbeachae]|uniref:3-methyl-2-oxobutanoate dehydrogenase (2-methylpropanoyl-transferring) n=1 Tax=Legionella longbeachae serogroup 1 (strain NSW150) TaxID=661367 RepID=D3HQ08_LEGLN|nr:alpha-ketoacid dehydrogenase subunit alpha/beta [Legionella longbeachae]VEE01492.1 pyruvate/2-oxoglutarate dehydrogenase subunit E1 [Legionella oakridgensis]HBD7396210.1 MFS transporter [Legionella pneumophila]ARB92151.1 MFS transporter [Legionella longbeachae]ARM34669.1 MFS transporter [Legionella longbeachae]EEZ96026.1 2-oxoisovalerate dehydrogenase E1 component [Legionella longbeachae D-4968]